MNTVKYTVDGLVYTMDFRNKEAMIKFIKSIANHKKVRNICYVSKSTSGGF